MERTTASPTVALPLLREEPRFRNPERTAWLALFGSFAICMLLAVGVPLGGRYYILNTRSPMQANVQAASVSQSGATSTIRGLPPGARQAIAISPEGVPMPEGSQIDTDAASKAFLTLFDGSTVTLSNDTTILLREMSTPLYSWSANANRMVVEQNRGSARYGAATPLSRNGAAARPLDFMVKTPHITAHLAPGSYSIEVDGNVSQVTVREGQALVSNSDPRHIVTVNQGQRIISRAGQPLPEAVGAAKNLIGNGDFVEDKLEPSWIVIKDQGGDAGNVDGTVQTLTLGDRHALQILRVGSENNSALTGVRQLIGKDISDFRSLTMKADVRLHNQDLPGGGYLSTEYPLIILLKYRDANNNDSEWVQGFWYQNENNNPVRNGNQIPRDVWVPYESGNLLTGINPRPVRLVSIAIYASGWDYESYISGVQLLAE